MARPRRIDWPHTFYHVLSRGNERRTVFEATADFEKFLGLLGRLGERYGIQVWSYVLMGNHYHLVVKTRDANLSQAMQWLGTSYTSYFNRERGRSGHLFQGRYKSFVIEEEHYLRQLILYVHRNPLRAGMVGRVSDYGWSSYVCLGYGRRCRPWLKRGKTLGLFGDDPSEFRRQVQEYSEEAVSLLEDLRHGLALCSEKAAKAVKAKLPRVPVETDELARRLQTCEPVQEVLAELGGKLSLSTDELAELTRPIRGIERPLRDALIYLVWRQGSYGLAEIGRHSGVGYASISHSRKRGEEYVGSSKELQRALGIAIP